MSLARGVLDGRDYQVSLSRFKLYRDEQGFWAVDGTRCRVGAVAFCFNHNGFLQIRKASKRGYEFSNMFALPGGMIRPLKHEGFEASCLRSLKERVLAESGLDISAHCRNEPSNSESIVTSYSVDGKKSYTVVTVHAFEVLGEFDPFPRDNSVSKANWQPFGEINWAKYAPANRLAIFERLNSKGIFESNVKTDSAIIAAAKTCKLWAIESQY